MDIQKHDSLYLFTSDVYRIQYDNDRKMIKLFNAFGCRHMDIPANVLLKCSAGDISFNNPVITQGDNFLTFEEVLPANGINRIKLVFEFQNDSILVSYEAEASQVLSINSVTFFIKGNKGLYMVNNTRYFSPVPRSNDGCNNSFNRNFPDCGIDGFFSPPPLHFSIGGKNGWVCFGLADLPDSYEFKLTGDLGILVENPAGHKKIHPNKTYYSPGLIITFPGDEWDSISLFREKLISLGKHSSLPIEERNLPDWWKEPMVCTYGDQMLDLQYNWYTDND